MSAEGTPLVNVRPEDKSSILFHDSTRGLPPLRRKGQMKHPVSAVLYSPKKFSGLLAGMYGVLMILRGDYGVDLQLVYEDEILGTVRTRGLSEAVRSQVVAILRTATRYYDPEIKQHPEYTTSVVKGVLRPYSYDDASTPRRDNIGIACFIFGCAADIVDEHYLKTAVNVPPASGSKLRQNLSDLSVGDVIIWGPWWALGEAEQAVRSGFSMEQEAAIRMASPESYGWAQQGRYCAEVSMSRAALRAVAPPHCLRAAEAAAANTESDSRAAFVSIDWPAASVRICATTRESTQFAANAIASSLEMWCECEVEVSISNRHRKALLGDECVLLDKIPASMETPPLVVEYFIRPDKNGAFQSAVRCRAETEEIAVASEAKLRGAIGSFIDDWQERCASRVVQVANHRHTEPYALTIANAETTAETTPIDCLEAKLLNACTTDAEVRSTSSAMMLLRQNQSRQPMSALRGIDINHFSELQPELSTQLEAAKSGSAMIETMFAQSETTVADSNDGTRSETATFLQPHQDGLADESASRRDEGAEAEVAEVVLLWQAEEERKQTFLSDEGPAVGDGVSEGQENPPGDNADPSHGQGSENDVIMVPVGDEDKELLLGAYGVLLLLRGDYGVFLDMDFEVSMVRLHGSSATTREKVAAILRTAVRYIDPDLDQDPGFGIVVVRQGVELELIGDEAAPTKGRLNGKIMFYTQIAGSIFGCAAEVILRPSPVRCDIGDATVQGPQRRQELGDLVTGDVVLWGPRWALAEAEQAVRQGFSMDVEAAERKRNKKERVEEGFNQEIFMSRAALRAVAVPEKLRLAETEAKKVTRGEVLICIDWPAGSVKISGSSAEMVQTAADAIRPAYEEWRSLEVEKEVVNRHRRQLVTRRGALLDRLSKEVTMFPVIAEYYARQDASRSYFSVVRGRAETPEMAQAMSEKLATTDLVKVMIEMIISDKKIAGMDIHDRREASSSQDHDDLNGGPEGEHKLMVVSHFTEDRSTSMTQGNTDARQQTPSGKESSDEEHTEEHTGGPQVDLSNASDLDKEIQKEPVGLDGGSGGAGTKEAFVERVQLEAVVGGKGGGNVGMGGEHVARGKAGQGNTGIGAKIFRGGEMSMQGRSKRQGGVARTHFPRGGAFPMGVVNRGGAMSSSRSPDRHLQDRAMPSTMPFWAGMPRAVSNLPPLSFPAPSLQPPATVFHVLFIGGGMRGMVSVTGESFVPSPQQQMPLIPRGSTGYGAPAVGRPPMRSGAPAGGRTSTRPPSVRRGNR